MEPSPSLPATAETLALVTPFLDGSESQVLVNAALALAAIGTPESAVRLADLAVLRTDPRVRRCATQELEKAPGEAREAAAERARDLLLASREPRAEAAPSPDAGREQAGRANDLLVALRRKGTAVALPAPPLPEWLGWLQKRSRPAWWERLAPVWKSAAVLDRYLGLFWNLRTDLVPRKPRRPFWWAFFLSLLWALPGVGLSFLLLAWIAPELDERAYLGVGVPTVLIAAALAAIFHGSVVPIDSYCHGRLGALVETLGILWRPAGAWWRQLSFPLAVGGVAFLGLAPMMLGFGDFKLWSFDLLAWILISWVVLLILFVAMRAVAAFSAARRRGHRISAVLGAAAGLVLGVLIGSAALRWKPDPIVAVLAGEGAMLLPALATAFLGEHWRASKTASRGLSRALVWPLIAIVVVTLPGVWLSFKSQANEARTWHLAHVPVERGFRGDRSQEVRATISDYGSTRPELRLRQNKRLIDGTKRLVDGTSLSEDEIKWNLPEAGTYTLEVTVGKLRVKPNRLSFVVSEGYATAVSCVARRLLEGRVKEESIPGSLTGPYKLKLIVGPASAPGGS